ncbi:sensor histidine kinase [Dongia rigui]|uniref:histidine kinase n=1 Tax=Dongia rigui TaxID=940149 RepID=A0ABU5DVD2_9PROT|nr:CHASE3 domain-containing protein [Dongia rigui]MDY0870937.1 CHASE3 domain-containing protein [Dongia rigui]
MPELLQVEVDSAEGAAPRPVSQLLILIGATALVAIIAVVSVLLTLDNRDAGTEMLRGQRVTTDIARLLIFVQRAESSQRGFLLTTNPAYLDLYHDSIKKVGPALETLTESTRNDTELAAEILNLRTLVNAKLGEMEHVLVLSQNGHQDEALGVVKTNAGKSLMDQIRESIAAMWQASTRQTEVRIAAWHRNSNWLLAVQLGAAMLVLSVSTLAVLSGIRHTRGLQQTQRALRHANELLEERVAARTADLQEANEEVQKFAYIISHDLRSPLVNIMGFTAELATIRRETAQMLGIRDEAGLLPRPVAEIDQEFGEALDFIQQSTVKMDRLISAVLKLARSGQRRFHYELIDMNALLGEIAATLKHRTSELDAEIVVEPLPALVTDRLAAEQIFSNLLDNAVKYLDESRLGRIQVRGRAIGRAVIIEIEDNGRGITPEDQARVFDLFRRGGKQDRPGEGIGLAHLRVLIRRLGGKISCRSEFGVGSVFSVLLPQADPSPLAEPQETERTAL